MRRGPTIFLALNLFAAPALVADTLAIHLDLTFKGCSPDAEVFSVTFPGGGMEDALLQEEGRWRITLRDAVNPRLMELRPGGEALSEFSVQPAKGKTVQGIGRYTFECRRLKSLVVQSDPFDPPLEFQYEITNPQAAGRADTMDAVLSIHPRGGIAIFLEEGDCHYPGPRILITSLANKTGKMESFPLLDFWAQACGSVDQDVPGLDMGIAAAQLAREKERASKKPRHNLLILSLDERTDG